MSDTFDHEGDAWNSYDRAQEDETGHHGHYRRRGYSGGSSYRPPPSYVAVPVVHHIHSTAKADLVVITIQGENHERWLPKSKTIFQFADMIQIDSWLMTQILNELKTRK